MIRLSTILKLSTVLLILFVFLAWLRPRVFDEKLIFIPKSLDSSVLDHKFPDEHSLYQQVIKTDKPDFNENVLNEIKANLSSHSTRDFLIALASIRKGLTQNVDFPSYMRDKKYLRSMLAECMRADLYYLHSFFQQYPNTNPFELAGVVKDKKGFSDYLWDVIYWILKEFTFEKNTTLNEYWIRIQAFENSEEEDIKVDYEWTKYSFGNFYGEIVLNLAIPSVSYITKLIEKIGI